jgi:hypothetical protein
VIVDAAQLLVVRFDTEVVMGPIVAVELENEAVMAVTVEDDLETKDEVVFG